MENHLISAGALCFWQGCSGTNIRFKIVFTQALQRLTRPVLAPVRQNQAPAGQNRDPACTLSKL
jgi:hypothetical protein